MCDSRAPVKSREGSGITADAAVARPAWLKVPRSASILASRGASLREITMSSRAAMGDIPSPAASAASGSTAPACSMCDSRAPVKSSDLRSLMPGRLQTYPGIGANRRSARCLLSLACAHASIAL